MGKNKFAKAAEPVVVSLAELGSTGLKRFSGYIREEFHPDLKGTLAAKVYREMLDNHPVINAAFLLVDLLCRQASKTVTATGTTPEHLLAQDLIDTALKDLEGGLDGAISDALTCGPFGWSALEKVFKIRRGESPVAQLRSKYDDGRIGWLRWGVRSQEALLRWEFDDAGTMTGLWQQPPPDYRLRFIPRDKFLHFRLRAPKGSPEGRPMLRGIYVPYYFEKHLRFIESVGIERNIAGLPVMEVPPEILNSKANTDQAAALASFKAMVAKVKVDEYGGLVIPSEETPDGKKTGYRFRLMSTAGKSNSETDPVVRRHRSEIAIGLFSEFLLLGQNQVGSFALSSDKTAMFALGVGALLDAVIQPINEDAIPELCALNGLPRSVAPVLEHGDIETPSLTEIAQYVGTLTGAGAMSIDDALERRLREIGGLPAPIQAAPAA